MDELAQLKTAVLASAKYRHVAPQLIITIGQAELDKGRSLKAAIKATKNKLHQVGGAYQDKPIDYERAARELRVASNLGEAAWTTAVTNLMQLHTSTRERLPILAEFYQATLADLPPIRRVIDIASGLNPLAVGWMPLSPTVEYVAYDIYDDMMQFLTVYFALAQIEGQGVTRDVIHQPPTEPADLALLLKTLPVLEQVDKTAVSRLLDALNARYLLISFPVHSLGGRRKGMPMHYSEQMDRWLDGRLWSVQRFDFDTELAFLVKTDKEGLV